MKSSRHGFAIIGTPAGPEGVVAEWDSVSKVVSKGRDPRSVTMQEVVTKNLLSIDASTSFSVVSHIVTEKGVRRLLAKEGNRVVGFITSMTMLTRMNDYEDKISAQISGLQAPWV